MTTTTDSEIDGIVEQDFREAMIRCGRASGASLADSVSTEFLRLVPGEVEASFTTLRTALTEARAQLAEAEARGREKGIEEAAAVADRKQRSLSVTTDFTNLARTIATAIRALKGQGND